MKPAYKIRKGMKLLRYAMRCKKLGFDLEANDERKYQKLVNINYYGKTKRDA